MHYSTHGIKINKYDRILAVNYLMVLVAILFSKTMYFGVHTASTFQYVFYALCIFGFFYSKGSLSVLSTNLIRVGLLWLPLVIQILLNFDSFVPNGLNSVLGLMIKIVCSAFFASSMSNLRFRRCYVNIMYIICIASIPCFLISLFFPSVVRNLAMTSFQWQNTYEYSWFYTWGRAGTIITKNAGPFWEQGAFQGFINLAIMFLMDSFRNNYSGPIIKYKKKLIVFLITVLTTQSTTGYILCIFILMFFYRDIKTILISNRNGKNLKKVLVFIAAISVISYILLSGNITNKLTNAETQSAAVRANDFIYSISFILMGGLWGLGPTTKALMLESGAGLLSNSVGLLSMAYSYGLVFASVYVFFQYQYLKTFQSEKSKLLVYILIFLILHCTEGYWFLPVFLIMLMKFKKCED